MTGSHRQWGTPHVRLNAALHSSQWRCIPGLRDLLQCLALGTVLAACT